MGISFVGGGFRIIPHCLFFGWGEGAFGIYPVMGDHSQHHAFKHAVSLEPYL